MSNGDIFYVCGIALAVSAVLVSLLGLQLKDFPGRFAPLVALWFIALIGGATTFAVLHGQDEQNAKAAELSKASEEAESTEAGAPSAQPETESEGAPKPPPSAKGQEETLQLAADPAKIAFDSTELSAKPGKVTIDFTNPSALEHDVAIEQNGKVLAKSELIAEGKTSVSAELEPGTYTFLCTVPGHAEAGMEGTLTVK
jgi:plastocyanin